MCRYWGLSAPVGPDERYSSRIGLGSGRNGCKLADASDQRCVLEGPLLEEASDQRYAVHSKSGRRHAHQWLGLEFDAARLHRIRIRHRGT